MGEQPHPSDDERIRKVVGRSREPVRPLQRVYELRQRLLALGAEEQDDDERIRKVVGRSE